MLWKVAFCVLVPVHMVVVLSNMVALCVLPFMEPWYVALPLCSFLVLLSCSRDQCPFTRFENKLRRKLGLTPIHGFIGHYLLGKR